MAAGAADNAMNPDGTKAEAEVTATTEASTVLTPPNHSNDPLEKPDTISNTRCNTYDSLFYVHGFISPPRETISWNSLLELATCPN